MITSPLTPSAGEVWTEPATRVSVGRAARKVDWPTEVLQAPGFPVGMGGF